MTALCYVEALLTWGSWACVIVIAILIVVQTMVSNSEPSDGLGGVDKGRFLPTKGKKIRRISFFILIFTIAQFGISEKQKQKDEKKLKAERDYRDSIIMKNTQTNADTLFNKVSRALAKEGYKIDLFKEEFTRLNFEKVPKSDENAVKSEVEALRYPLDRINAKFIFNKAADKSDLALTLIRLYVLDSSSEKIARKAYSLDRLNSEYLARDGIKDEYQALWTTLTNFEENEIYETDKNYVVIRENVFYGAWTPNKTIKSIKDLAKAGIIVTIWPHDSKIIPQSIIFEIPTKDGKYVSQFFVLGNPKYSEPLYVYRGHIEPGRVEVALRAF